MNNRAFTLIELLVVLSIISVVSSSRSSSEFSSSWIVRSSRGDCPTFSMTVVEVVVRYGL